MSSHPPPSEGSDSSFWASVYTHEPANVLCGLLTDINLHRFTLRQHLTTHRALMETPLLHPPFQRAMPDALYKPTFNFIPAVANRLKSMYVGHSQPLKPLDDTLPGYISNSLNQPSMMIQPLRSYSQHQTNSSPGTPSIYHRSRGITSAARPPQPTSCNIPLLRPLPLNSITKPRRPTRS